MFSADLKRGSLEMLVLSVLETRARHGYEIGKSLEKETAGKLAFRVSTLYSMLYRMEKRKWIKGRWVEKAGERRRCLYSLTPLGRKTLARQQQEWRSFVETVELVLEAQRA